MIAWVMMKQNPKHKTIVPDHGPLFVETMLDYLTRVQKEKSKSIIMSQHNNPQNQANIFTNLNNNNYNQQMCNDN